MLGKLTRDENEKSIGKQFFVAGGIEEFLIEADRIERKTLRW